MASSAFSYENLKQMSTYGKSHFPQKWTEEDLPNAADEHNSPTYYFFSFLNAGTKER